MNSSYITTKYNNGSEYESTSFGCIAEMKTSIKNYDFDMFIAVNEVVQGVDVEEWSAFVNKCAMPNKVVEKTNGYVHIKFKHELFNSVGHFMAAFTAVRSCLNLSLNSNRNKAIPPWCLKIAKERPDISPIELLQLAHYIGIGSYMDKLHQLFTDVSKLVDEDYFLENCKLHNSCNKGFYKAEVNKTYTQISNLVNSDIDEALKALR